MQESTINAIKTLAGADPEASPEQVRVLLAACKNPTARRKTIRTREALAILGISGPTLRNLIRSGKLTRIQPTPRTSRFYLDEVEALAFSPSHTK